MGNSQKGQTIIEALVALVTILLILTAISIVIVNGLFNSRFIKNQNEANKYAQQGMEYVRNIQGNDLNTFAAFNQNATYCIDEANSTLTTTNCDVDGVNTGESYNRTVIFSPAGGECSASEVKVMVTVKWVSSKCPSTNTFCHKSQLASCLPFMYTQRNP